MTFSFIFYLVSLAFPCHIPVGVSCIEYQKWIRSFLLEYQVSVTDTHTKTAHRYQNIR